MQEGEIYGKLFNVIPLMDENHVDILLDTMDKETAIYYLTHAVNLAFHNGVYSLGESEILSKSIRLLNKPDSPIES
jgi:hypothetical protein